MYPQVMIKSEKEKESKDMLLRLEDKKRKKRITTKRKAKLDYCTGLLLQVFVTL